MFGDYSITTASRHPSSIPCREEFDAAAGYPAPDVAQTLPRALPRHLSISQLTQRFSEQRLHQDTPHHARSEPCSIEQDNSIAALDSSLSTTYIGSPTPSTRRMQRQQGVRMLCDPSHLRSIQDMVEKMVHSEDQCSVSPSRKLSLAEDCLSDSRDDEGYSSLEDNMPRSRRDSATLSSSSLCNLEVRYKRSTDWSTTGASVSKNVRVRKTRNRKSMPRSP